MTEPIKIILLDADGVVQMPTPDWRDRLEALAGECGRDNQFLADIFAAEERCLTGQQDFASALDGVMKKWGCHASIDDILQLWTLIEPNQQVLGIINQLQQGGHSVCLATNQHPHRANYMSRELGYDQLFDRSFYSCELGHAKPSRAYFIELLDRLGHAGSEALFIDDRDSNVVVARQVGINAEQFHLMEGVDELRRKLRIHHINLD